MNDNVVRECFDKLLENIEWEAYKTNQYSGPAKAIENIKGILHKANIEEIVIKAKPS